MPRKAKKSASKRKYVEFLSVELRKGKRLVESVSVKLPATPVTMAFMHEIQKLAPKKPRKLTFK